MKTSWRLIADPVTYIFTVYWHQSRWTLLLVVVVMFLTATSTVAAPFVFSRLIDQLSGEFVLSGLLFSFVVYAVLLGSSNALSLIVRYMSVFLSENLSFITATSFFEKLVKKRVSFFVDHNPTEIQSALQKGEDGLGRAAHLAVIVFVPGITQIAFALIVLGAVINLEIVLIVLVYGTVFIGFTYLTNKWTRKYLEKGVSAQQEGAKFVGNSINAMETLRQFNSDRWIIGRFTEKAEEVRESWRQFSLRRIAYATIFGVALAVQFAFTFFVLMPRYVAGELSVGDIVLFNTLLLQLNVPFELIGHTIDDLVRSYTQLVPFSKMWAAPEEPEPAEFEEFALERGELTFENVGFVYGNGRGTKEVSFSSGRGQVTFLVGETGSGKSTVFKLALKSLEPQTGSIKIDDINLNTVSRADWFAHVGVVPQDIVLLNESLASNIVLGREHDVEKMRRAAERASILEFIDALPEGFETNVGERGLRLSGGERQRIAIARALYADPKILFLDEASAALDEATEADIMSGLRTLKNDITILAITHRKSIIQPEDKVVELAESKCED